MVALVRLSISPENYQSPVMFVGGGGAKGIILEWSTDVIPVTIHFCRCLAYLSNCCVVGLDVS